ncbi:unnamed protein product [Caretta caretta]
MYLLQPSSDIFSRATVSLTAVAAGQVTISAILTLEQRRMGACAKLPLSQLARSQGDRGVRQSGGGTQRAEPSYSSVVAATELTKPGTILGPDGPQTIDPWASIQDELQTAPWSKPRNKAAAIKSTGKEEEEEGETGATV